MRSDEVKTVIDVNGQSWTGVITCNAENNGINDEAKYVRVANGVTVKPKDMKKLFQNKGALIRVNLFGFDTSDIVDMSSVFLL